MDYPNFPERSSPVFLQNLKVQLYFRQKLIRASRKTLRWSSGCRNPVADFTFTIHTKRIVHVSVWLLRITLRLAFRQGRVWGGSTYTCVAWYDPVIIVPEFMFGMRRL